MSEDKMTLKQAVLVVNLDSSPSGKESRSKEGHKEDRRHVPKDSMKSITEKIQQILKLLRSVKQMQKHGVGGSKAQPWFPSYSSSCVWFYILTSQLGVTHQPYGSAPPKLSTVSACFQVYPVRPLYTTKDINQLLHFDTLIS